jgi:two-component system alkaline phosphatase synthesis response regulator PhoP/two-component system response regulator VicR
MKRILICDDEPHVVEGLRFLLRGPDRQIETAVNGRDGLERIRRQRPDLLITDVMMPEMSGLELVAALRADPATRNLPIIICTARGQVYDAGVAQEVWSAVVVAKPFEPPRVRQIVAEMLAGTICANHSYT